MQSTCTEMGNQDGHEKKRKFSYPNSKNAGIISTSMNKIILYFMRNLSIHKYKGTVLAFMSLLDLKNLFALEIE